MSVKERVKFFCSELGISISEFEKTINVSNGYVNNISESIGRTKLEYILEKYPNLNLEWLLLGKGEMLKASITTGDVTAENTKYNYQLGNSSVVSGGQNINVNENLQDADIAEKEKRITDYHKTFTDELNKFHEVQSKKDEYIERIIRNSYELNEKNMTRIDVLVASLKEKDAQIEKILETVERLVSKLTN